MSDVKIQDYIGTAKELTAAEVRKLEPGTRILRHSFDRHGVHQTLEVNVVQSGRSKALSYTDGYGLTQVKKIENGSDRVCYTEVQT